MKVAQQEIKTTVTVNTSDLGNKKKDEDSDRDVPSRKRGNPQLFRFWSDKGVKCCVLNSLQLLQ